MKSIIIKFKILFLVSTIGLIMPHYTNTSLKSGKKGFSFTEKITAGAVLTAAALIANYFGIPPSSLWYYLKTASKGQITAPISLELDQPLPNEAVIVQEQEELLEAREIPEVTSFINRLRTLESTALSLVNDAIQQNIPGHESVKAVFAFLQSPEFKELQKDASLLRSKRAQLNAPTQAFTQEEMARLTREINLLQIKIFETYHEADRNRIISEFEAVIQRLQDSLQANIAAINAARARN